MEKSAHLGIGNIEVLSNTVSANSHKLMAFNTLAEAVEAFWTGEPLNEDDLEKQSDFLRQPAQASRRRSESRITKSHRPHRVSSARALQACPKLIESFIGVL